MVNQLDAIKHLTLATRSMKHKSKLASVFFFLLFVIVVMVEAFHQLLIYGQDDKHR